MDNPEISAPEPPEPPAPKGLRRRIVLFSVLAVLVPAWMFTVTDQRRIQAEVAPLTLKHEKDLAEGGLEVASTVTVSRPYILAGAPSAKIEVFCRSGQPSDPRIQGVAYYYKLDGSGWTLTESAGCTSEECQVQGAKAFAAKDAGS